MSDELNSSTPDKACTEQLREALVSAKSQSVARLLIMT